MTKTKTMTGKISNKISPLDWDEIDSSKRTIEMIENGLHIQYLLIENSLELAIQKYFRQQY